MVEFCKYLTLVLGTSQYACEALVFRRRVTLLLQLHDFGHELGPCGDVLDQVYFPVHAFADFVSYLIFFSETTEIERLDEI